MRLIALYNKHAGRTAAALVALTALAVFLYGALLLGAVAHAAGRTAAEQQLRTLSSAVSALEGRYLSATQALGPERATAMGFVAPSAVATVYAGAPSLVLR